MATIKFISIGTLKEDYLREAVAEYEKCNAKSVAIYDMRYAKPLDEELICEVAQRVEKILTIEDGVLRGGVGEAVVKLLNDHHITTPVVTLGIGDTFIEQGTVTEQRAECGIDAEAIKKAFGC